MNVYINHFYVYIKLNLYIYIRLNHIYIYIYIYKTKLKKQERSRKTSTSALLTSPKPLTVWITTNCGKFWKRWEYQTTLPASCMQVLYAYLYLYASQEATVTGRYETDWFKIGKGLFQAMHCHSVYLTSLQSASHKKLGWMKLKLESRLLGEISVTSDMQMTSPIWQKVKRN